MWRFVLPRDFPISTILDPSPDAARQSNLSERNPSGHEGLHPPNLVSGLGVCARQSFAQPRYLDKTLAKLKNTAASAM